MKKIRKVREVLTKERILLLFELGKKLKNEYTYKGDKNIKIQTRWIYKSFEKLYPWMPYNKTWKLRHFRDMSVKDAEEIAHNWISMKLNPIEGENIWQNQD